MAEIDIEVARIFVRLRSKSAEVFRTRRTDSGERLA